MFRNPNQLCRLCLSEESLGSVFEEEGLNQWISDYLSIMISTEDRLSQAVCAICRIRLEEFHQFRIRSQEVQGVLQIQMENEEVESDESMDEPNTDSPATVELQTRGDSGQHVQPYQCDFCQKQLATQKKLTDHRRYHLKKTESLKEGKQREGDVIYQCDVCHKVFQTRKQYRDHSRYHQSYKHICKRCGKSFERRQRMVKHMKTSCRPEAKETPRELQKAKETPRELQKSYDVLKTRTLGDTSKTRTKEKPKDPKKVDFVQSESSNDIVEIKTEPYDEIDLTAFELDPESRHESGQSKSSENADSSDNDLQDISVILKLVAGITQPDAGRWKIPGKKVEKEQPIGLQDMIVVEEVKIENRLDDDNVMSDDSSVSASMAEVPSGQANKRRKKSS